MLGAVTSEHVGIDDDGDVVYFDEEPPDFVRESSDGEDWRWGNDDGDEDAGAHKGMSVEQYIDMAEALDHPMATCLLARRIETEDAVAALQLETDNGPEAISA